LISGEPIFRPATFIPYLPCRQTPSARTASIRFNRNLELFAAVTQGEIGAQTGQLRL